LCYNIIIEKIRNCFGKALKRAFPKGLSQSSAKWWGLYIGNSSKEDTMLLTALVLAATFIAGMVALDLLMRLSGGGIVLPEDSFLVRFWRERRDENPRTLCEIILLLTTTTVGNILGGLLLLLVVIGIPVGIVALGVMIGLDEKSLGASAVAMRASISIVVMIAALAVEGGIVIGAMFGADKAIKVAERKFRISRVIFPVFRAIAWPFRTALKAYRIVRDRACPIVVIAESGPVQA